MYRILASEHGDVEERPAAGQRPHYNKPELVGHRYQSALVLGYRRTQGQADGLLFYLYVIMDVFQPLRRRLDGCPLRTKGAGQTPD